MTKNRDELADVLVIGGGTAGFGAAVTAGRQGLNVILIETSTKVGGVMAFCPGMPWGAAYPSDKIVGGLMGELTERLENMDPPAAEKRPCTLENFGPEIIYDHDIATLTMFEMLEHAGVKVRLSSTAVTPKTVWPNTFTENAYAITSVSGVVATSIQTISESVACGHTETFAEAQSKPRLSSSLPRE